MEKLIKILDQQSVLSDEIEQKYEKLVLSFLFSEESIEFIQKRTYQENASDFDLVYSFSFEKLKKWFEESSEYIKLLHYSPESKTSRDYIHRLEKVIFQTFILNNKHSLLFEARKLMVLEQFPCMHFIQDGIVFGSIKGIYTYLHHNHQGRAWKLSTLN